MKQKEKKTHIDPVSVYKERTRTRARQPGRRQKAKGKRQKQKIEDGENTPKTKEEITKQNRRGKKLRVYLVERRDEGLRGYINDFRSDLVEK